MSFSSSQNLEMIQRVTSLLSPSKYMQFCNEQIRTQPLFSPPCASATYGSARMCRQKNVHTRKESCKWPFCLSLNVLTHWGLVMHRYVCNLAITGFGNSMSPVNLSPLAKMAAISQTTFSNFVFYFEFHWSLFLRVCIVSIGSGNGSVLNRRQTVACTNLDPVH